MGWRNFLGGRVICEMGRKSEVPARQALVEKREEGLAALPEDTNANRVDIGYDLERGNKKEKVSKKSLGTDGDGTPSLTRWIMTASAPAALKQEIALVLVGGYLARFGELI